MRITFWGAAETVTGSRFVVETDRARVLVDCGLFQGVKRQRQLNWAPFPVDPASLDAVVLTHAHIDHSGYLPALVRDGFKGRIWCTPGTASLAKILLPDSAHLQEEDAWYHNKRGSSRHRPALPLYTQDDAEVALTHLHRQGVDAPFEPAPGIEARFSRAGHILGASSVWLSDGSRSVLFSGDLGRDDDLVMRPPAARPAADHIVVESTYGDSVHPADDSAEILADVVARTVARGGSVLVPVFAVGRAQTLMLILSRLRQAGRIPPVPLYLNSPMAVNVTELYMASHGEHTITDEELAAMAADVELVRTMEESKALTDRAEPMVVFSASGMVSGGRVLHHLRRIGPDRRSTIVLVGYQAAGTRGQAIRSGATHVRVFGEDVPIRAEVVCIDSLSAHADADGLLRWLGGSGGRPSAISIVHGEPVASDALRARIEHELGWPAEVPAAGDSVRVDPRPS